MPPFDSRFHAAHPADPYAALPEMYDLEHDGFVDDIALYLNIAGAVGDPILELGCGTGRVMRPLVEAGFRVTGLDRSRPMLDRAARALEPGQRSGVTLHQGEIERCDHAPGGPFGLVLAPLDAVLLATEPGAQRATLEACRRALDPRGQLVIDVLNPTPDALRALEHGVIHEGSWSPGDGTTVDKFSSRRVRPAEQVIETTLWYEILSPDGAIRRLRTAYELRYLHRAELELLLEVTGFREWEIYGGYDLEPYDDRAERMIVTADPTPSRR